jgi:hypothetical protein
VRFEPTIPVFERTKTVHALDGAATVIGACIQPQDINLCLVLRACSLACLDKSNGNIQFTELFVSPCGEITEYRNHTLLNSRRNFIHFQNSVTLKMVTCLLTAGQELIISFTMRRLVGGERKSGEDT